QKGPRHVQVDGEVADHMLQDRIAAQARLHTCQRDLVMSNRDDVVECSLGDTKPSSGKLQPEPCKHRSLVERVTWHSGNTLETPRPLLRNEEVFGHQIAARRTLQTVHIPGV